MENVRKQRYQTCNKWNKKELVNIRAKLSYNEMFFLEVVLAIEMKKT